MKIFSTFLYYFMVSPSYWQLNKSINLNSSLICSDLLFEFFIWTNYMNYILKIIKHILFLPWIFLFCQCPPFWNLSLRLLSVKDGGPQTYSLKKRIVYWVLHKMVPFILFDLWLTSKVNTSLKWLVNQKKCRVSPISTRLFC